MFKDLGKKILVMSCLFAVVFLSEKSFSASSEPDLSLGYTHLLSPAYVLPGGSYELGTTIGVGFFDFLELSTNAVYDLEGVFNATVKLGIIQGHDFAFAPYLSYSSQSITYIIDSQGDTSTVTSTAWYPGATFSYRLASDITGHSGGTIVNRTPPIPKGSIPRTALVQGTTGNQEFTFGFSRRFAVSIGGSYDFTYDIGGAGLSFHIGPIQIGGHYYFNVQQGNFLPILGGAYVADL